MLSSGSHMTSLAQHQPLVIKDSFGDNMEVVMAQALLYKRYLIYGFVLWRQPIIA
jgi:hypothetical protein